MSGRPLHPTSARRGSGRVAHDDGDLLDHILATHPSYVGSMNLAEAEVAKGQRGRPLDEVIADLDSET